MAETNWAEYLLALSAFAGTVFALVLAARQIRGQHESGQAQPVLDYRLADSIAVTAELAIAAGFGILYRIAPSYVFTGFVCFIALTGAILSGRAAFTYVRARRKGHLKGDSVELIQAIGNLLPLLCYATAFSYGARRFLIHDGVDIWAYVTAATWLAFSGCFQALRKRRFYVRQVVAGVSCRALRVR